MLLTSNVGEKYIKPPQTFFTFSKSLFKKIILNDKNKEFVTSNRRSKHYFSWKLRKNTNFSRFNNYDVVTILLSRKNKMELQTWRVFRSIANEPPYNESFVFTLEHLVSYENEGVKKFGQKPRMGLDLYESVFYTGNLDKEFKKGPLKYIDMYLPRLGYFEKYEDIFEKAYKYRESLEFLKDIKATEMYESIIKGNADMRKVTRNYLRRNKFYLKNYNFDFRKIEFTQSIKSIVKLNPINLNYIKNDRVSNYNFQDIVDYSKIINREVNTLFTYLAKNNINPRYYKDYINMLIELELLTHRKNDVFPKDIVKAHDELVLMVDKKKSDAHNKKMAARVKETQRYKFNNGTYSIIDPKNALDIIQEGKALKHCVWSNSYIEGHASGKTVILFVRENSKIDTPLFTLEYKNGKVVQLRGLSNVSAPQDIQQFVEEWKEHLKKEERKKINAKNIKRNKPSYNRNKETEQYRQATR